MLLFIIVSCIIYMISIRLLVKDFRKIAIYLFICSLLLAVSSVIGLYTESNPDLLLYEQLAIIAALFIVAGVVHHIRTHICVRCSVGEYRGH